MNPEPTVLDPEAAVEVAPEDRPDLEPFVIDDGKPVDNVFTEKQQRLLAEPLRASWAGPEDGGPWVACTNVGLFYALKHPPLAPDMMLAVGVEQGSDLTEKANRSYFVWTRRKAPDVVIEIVSDRRGGEETLKMREYATANVLYYVIFDPADLLGGGVLRGFRLDGRDYRPAALDWLPEVGLGLRLWEGQYEEMHGDWLRWCDREGNPIPTGKERAEQEKQRAEQAEERAEDERHRAEQEKQRAEQEKQRAEQAEERAEDERQRAEQEKQRAEQAEERTAQERQEAERLRAKLRELGIDPSV